MYNYYSKLYQPTRKAAQTMRKFLSIFLALALIVSLALTVASCKKTVSIYDIFDASTPTKATSVVSYTDADGTKFEGLYLLTASGEDFMFEYSYQRLRTFDEAIAEGNSETVKTVSGTLYSVGGTTLVVGDEFDSFVPAFDSAKLNLNEAFLSGISYSEDGKSLTATLSGANIAKVLGIDLLAEGDVSISVVTDGTYARGFDVSYTTKSGATVTVRTSYTYNPVTVKLPSVA